MSKQRYEAWISCHHREASHGLAEGPGVAPLQRLLESQAAGQSQQADEPQDQEDSSPGGKAEQDCPKCRSGHGRYEHHGGDPGQDHLSVAALVNILDHGRGHGRGGAGSHCLEHPEEDELIDILRCGAEESRQGIDAQAHQQDGPPTVFIAPGSPEEHSRREEYEEEYQGEVDLFCGSLKVLGHAGQGRKIEVG